MRQIKRRSVVGWAALGFVLVLCTGTAQGQYQPAPVQPPQAIVAPTKVVPKALGLEDVTRIALERNPRLQQVALDIDVAQGRALQAGLYPNPTVMIGGEEIGPKGGIQTLPQVSIPIVTADKLRLSRAVALRAVSQAQLALYQQRFSLLTQVRQDFFEVLTLQQRIEVLTKLAELAQQTYENAKKLLEGKLIAELDVLPFQVQFQELQADLQAAQREREAAWRRLTANIGAPQLPPVQLKGSLQSTIPGYDFEQAKAFLLEAHPALLSAEVGIRRAQLAVRSARAQGVPNVSVGIGYQRNFNEELNQATYQVQVPIPVFNRNQGNVRAAQAQLAQAVQEVSRTQYALTSQLATAFGNYAAAKQRAELYRTAILPNANRSYELALQAFRGQQGFEYLQVLQAQQAVVQARLRYLRYLSDTWQAASEISGLLLEEHWPPKGDRTMPTR